MFAPVHIVFLEFVIDPACSIAFETEAAPPQVTKRPPRHPKEPLFGARLLVTAAVQGLPVPHCCRRAFGQRRETVSQ